MICIQTYACVYERACTHVWGPEVDFKCLSLWLSILFFNSFLFLIKHICIYMRGDVHLNASTQRGQSIRSPGRWVIGSRELPSMGAVNPAPVLCNISSWSEPLCWCWLLCSGFEAESPRWPWSWSVQLDWQASESLGSACLSKSSTGVADIYHLAFEFYDWTLLF